MWPFRPKVEAPAADGPRPVPAPVIRRDWVGLPPIQRIVGAHPLTAPTDRFRDDLTTHQDPSVSSDTMGHQVSAEAPPGLVLALARPTTRSDGPAMIPRPRLQRSAAGAVVESGEWDRDEAAPELARSTPLPASAHAVAARELPVVAPEPAVQRLISLPPDAAPTPVAPVAQRSAAAPSLLTTPSQGEVEMAPVPAQRLTLGQSRRMGLGAPIRRVPDRSVQRETIEATPSTSVDLPLPIAQRGTEPTETSSRPIEPMDTSQREQGPMDIPRAGSAPTDRPVQRAPMDLPLIQKAPIDRPAAQRAPIDLPMVFESPTDLPSPASGTRTSTPSAPLMPSLESSDEARLDLPLARRPAEATSAGDARAPAPSVQLSAASSAEASSDSSSPTSSGVQRLAEVGSPTPSSTESRRPLSPADAPTASMQRVSTSRLPLAIDAPARPASPFATVPAKDTATMAPLVGSMPLRTSAVLQRAASTDPPTPHPDPPPQGGREVPFTGGMELPLMTATDDGHPEGDAIDAPSLSFLQRVSEAAPHPDPGPTQTLPQRMPLAPSRGIAVQRASQAAEEIEPSGAGDEGFAPTVQGVWYESRVGVSRQSEGGATSDSVGSSAASAEVAPAGPNQASDADMDELARKLYDRLRSRLKTELLVDRERAGFLTDLR